jgi:hypothetical protein
MLFYTLLSDTEVWNCIHIKDCDIQNPRNMTWVQIPKKLFECSFLSDKLRDKWTRTNTEFFTAPEIIKKIV